MNNKLRVDLGKMSVSMRKRLVGSMNMIYKARRGTVGNPAKTCSSHKFK